MFGGRTEGSQEILHDNAGSRNFNNTQDEKNKKQNINDGEDDRMELLGYRASSVRVFFTWLGHILTIGMLRLFFHWYPRLKLQATHVRCSLKDAEKVLVVDDYQGHFKSYFVKDIKITSVCDISLSDINDSETTSGNGDKNISIPKTLTFHLEDGSFRETTSMRYVWVKKQCYVWDDRKEKFLKLVGLDKGMTNESFHEARGFNVHQQLLRRLTYGPNEITVPVQSIATLLVLEALTPFYIFQVFTLIVWLAEYYYYYTVAIIIMSVFGIASSIIQTRKNQLNLRGTVHSTEMARVCRTDGSVEDVPSSHLVPGDVLLIPAHGCVTPCDAVLLEGSCIVNESMLTGESVPVTKTPLPKTNVPYDIKEYSNHTLFCGTKIIQTRFYGSQSVRAVVIRTGYLTTKGQLVRSILYPPPVDFKFDKDSYRFIILLAVIATAGFLYTCISKFSRGLTFGDIVIKGLDIITIVVPPALPAAMTVGKLYAISRLKKTRIFCINSRIINVCGSINCVCFDKTGTLTEDGLDMWGVIPVVSGRLQEPVRHAHELPEDSLLLNGMVSCHSLTIIEEQMSGDPLDVKMFESTGWILEEPEVEDTAKFDLLAPVVVKAPKKQKKNSTTSELYEFEIPYGEIGIVQKYQFSSTLQRMSVVVRVLGRENFEVYCKGSPEMIVSLCDPSSVPSDIVDSLRLYTGQGYRVIALGRRVLTDMNYLKISKMHRDEAERDLTFLGLIILENQVKPESAGVIDVLKRANIKIVMITGDNIQTALSVARECGIVGQKDKIVNTTVLVDDKTGIGTLQYEESNFKKLLNKVDDALACNGSAAEDGGHDASTTLLAMTGNAWAALRKHCPDMVPKVVCQGAVFARMSGEQKQQLVQELQSVGYYVAMCGDGANDCGALKAAHTGISLSEAESSVASPFTAQDPNISCVPRVIREGRAALVTSFGIFKFMVAYSLTEFLSVLILYGIDSNLTSLQFLFIDICLVLNFASFFGKTEAFAGKLSKRPPMTSLLSFIPLLSLVVFMVMATSFQCGSYYIVQTFSWFVPFQYDPGDTTFYTSFENYAVFTISMFQYMTMAIIFSKGRPYRKAIYTNAILTVSILATTAVCVYITLSPAQWILDALEMELPPDYDMRFVVLGLAFANFVLCFLLEEFFIDYVVYNKLKPKFHNIEKSRKRYLKILQEIQISKWPLSNFPPPVVSKNGKAYQKDQPDAVVVEDETSHFNTKL